MYCVMNSAAIDGISALSVCAEADVSEGLPSFSMVGFLSSETREAGERVRAALRNSGFLLEAMHVTVNLAPAAVHKEGSLFDLAIACAILGAYGFYAPDAGKNTLFLGELNLNGEIGPVNGVLEIISNAVRFGCDTAIIPKRNLPEGSVIRGIKVFGAENLNQVAHYLMERSADGICILGNSRYEPPLLPPKQMETMQIDLETLRRRQTENCSADFSQIAGQELMRRAAEIAVSGFHNLLMIGPPGAGKTLTAKCIPTILPQMTPEESLEVTKIHSIAGTLPEEEGLLMIRPYRAPHHRITGPALCGGGINPRPGEISLAHRGVLYLDEMTEFDRSVLETLRGPMEDGCIRISRMTGMFSFPADFMLVASMNPCRCGYYPDRAKCSCTNAQVRRYLSKISMPLLDRIDMCVEAHKVRYEELTGSTAQESSAQIRTRVTQAAEIQKMRYRDTPFHFNADLNAEGVKQYCRLTEADSRMMRGIYDSMGLTARSYNRILKVARTIADLAGDAQIRTEHLMEAVSFRAIDRKYWDGACSA